MSTWSALKRSYGTYIANADPLAQAANAGATLVWSSQPLYPLYVFLLVGHDAWPALLTWFSTPVFAAVPIVARRSSRAGRATFIVAGVLNTLVSLAAFGPAAGIAWFLVPCLILAIGFYRWSEWPFMLATTALVAAAYGARGLMGAGLVAYTPTQAQALAHLNMWSAGGLSVYLLYACIRARRAPDT